MRRTATTASDRRELERHKPKHGFDYPKCSPPMNRRLSSAWLARLGGLVGGVAALTVSCELAGAQPATFAGNAQHTGIYGASAQTLNRVIWSTKIDLNNNGGYAHYGAPLITASNAVLVPVRTTNGFRVNAFEGKTGRLKYSLATDYIPQPGLAWHPPYQPAIAVSYCPQRKRPSGQFLS